VDEKTKKQLDRWVCDWRSGLTHISDLTVFAEDLIAEWQSLAPYHAIPAEIKGQIVEHVAEYARTGESSYTVSRTGDVVDRVATMNLIASLLKEE
jgi:hypothetical protein